MAIIASRMKHILISAEQAGVVAESIVYKMLDEVFDITAERLALFAKPLTSGFWYLDQFSRLSVLGKLNEFNRLATDKDVLVASKKLELSLAKNHASLLVEESREKKPEPSLKTMYKFDPALDPESISKYDVCTANGPTAKLAFTAAQEKGAIGIVDFEFMVSAKRYLIVDTNTYSYEECIQRIPKYRFDNIRRAQVFALILSENQGYVFFRHKL